MYHHKQSSAVSISRHPQGEENQMPLPPLLENLATQSPVGHGRRVAPILIDKLVALSPAWPFFFTSRRFPSRSSRSTKLLTCNTTLHILYQFFYMTTSSLLSAITDMDDNCPMKSTRHPTTRNQNKKEKRFTDSKNKQMQNTTSQGIFLQKR